MAAIKETDKDVIPDGREKDDILKIIQEEQIKDFEMSVKTATKTGDNYMGSIFAIDVQGKTTKDEISSVDMHLILKCSPRFPTFRQIIPVNSIFKREVHMYTKYLPEIYKIQELHNIKRGLLPVATLYKYNTQECDEYLIMKNMKSDNFSMLSRKTTLDFDHCELVLKQLGYLHGLAFVMKNNNLDLWNELIEPLKENMWDINKPEYQLYKQSFTNLVARAVNLIDPEKEKDVHEKCIKFKDVAFQETTYCNMYENFVNDPYSIVIHGDCWTNNILFKYNEENKPIELCLLDWQLSRISVPSIDLCYFIYNCTGTELRKNHFNDFIKIYHNALTNVVEKCGINPETCFPFSTLQEQIRKYFKFGVAMACQAIPMFISESEEIPEFQKIENFDELDVNMFNYTSKNNELYEERIRGVLFHAVSNGFI